MTMDWGTAAQWGALVIAIFSLVRGELRSQDKDYKEDKKAVELQIADVDRRIVHLETRVAKVESELAHLPRKDSVHGLEMAMQELKGQMAVIIERVGPIKAIAERMQEVLLEGTRK